LASGRLEAGPRVAYARIEVVAFDGPIDAQALRI
jgi:hypothetical protein